MKPHAPAPKRAPDPVAVVCQGYAARTLADLLQANAPSTGNTVSASAAVGLWRVTVVAEPADLRPSDLTPAEAAILDAFSSCTTRWTTSRVLEEVYSRGHMFCDTTIREALARLRHRKLLGNSRRTPRGYFLLHLVPFFPK